MQLTYHTVTKTSFLDHVLDWAKFKADQQIKKTDGTKRSRYVEVQSIVAISLTTTKATGDDQTGRC